MDIKIEKNHSKYLWTLIKDNPRDDNTDEQWTPTSDGNNFYLLFDYDNIVIKAIFEVLDPNAEMDSNDFCDWNNYSELYIVSDMETLY